MVCQACRSVETVDVGVGERLETLEAGVGDDLIMVQKVDLGVGDGFIDPSWLFTEISREEKGVKNVNSIFNQGTKTEERAAPGVEDKEIRNKSRKQCKPRKICNASKNTAAQSKPLKPKTKSLNKVSNSKSARAIAELNLSDEIVETSSTKAKSRLRFGRSRNSRERIEVSSFESAVSSEKSIKSRSTAVKADIKPGKRSSTFDELGSTCESFFNDSSGDVDQSKSENEDEIPSVKAKRKRIFKPAACKICGRSYKSSYLKRHMKTHEEDDDKKKPHQCEKCGQKFADFHYRNNHQAICGNDSQLLFQCHICAKRLCNKYSLELHIESHSSERSAQCHLCAKLFKSIPALNKHIKTHSELRSFACDLCEKRFKLKHSLMYHKARYHEGKVATFNCEVCDKVFCFKNSLTAHLEQHKGIKKYMCEVCGKRFGRHSLWKIHLRIHNETKSFSCTECGKGFNQKYDLKRHMSTHTGIKPFKCEQCGKQFIHRVYLVRHRCTATEQPGEHRRKTRQRQTRNEDSNNKMLSNVEPIVECGNMMASREMYDNNIF